MLRIVNCKSSGTQTPVSSDHQNIFFSVLTVTPVLTVVGSAVFCKKIGIFFSVISTQLSVFPNIQKPYNLTNIIYRKNIPCGSFQLPPYAYFLSPKIGTAGKLQPTEHPLYVKTLVGNQYAAHSKQRQFNSRKFLQKLQSHFS